MTALGIILSVLGFIALVGFIIFFLLIWGTSADEEDDQ